MADRQDSEDVEIATVEISTAVTDAPPAPPNVLEQARLGNLDQFQTELESGNHPLGFKAGRDQFFNRTPLHLAAMEGHEWIVRFILSHPEISGEVVNAKDSFGYTPLHLAVRRSHENIVSLLTTSSLVLPDRFLAATSEPDDLGLNRGGCTPLHFAAANGDMAIAELLLRQPHQVEFAFDPVNIFALNWRKSTPLDLARQEKFVGLEDFLEASDVNWLLQERARCAISVNAILVGAALVAASTFATWIQPPGGIPEPDSAASGAPTASPSASSSSSNEDRGATSLFCFLVTMAFVLSVISLVTGIMATFPFRKASLQYDLRLLRKALLHARVSLLAALVFLIFAFSIAGLIVFDKVASTERVIDKFIESSVIVIPLFTCGMHVWLQYFRI